MNKHTKIFLAIFALALLLRLITLFFTLSQLRPDTDLDNYRSLATHLAAGQGFVAETADGHTLPNVVRTPVYPLFLAALIKLGGNRLGLFLAVQCFLGALTCALTFLLATRWLRPAFAALAALLVTLDPNSILRCSDLRTETLFTLLLLAGALLIVWRPREIWSWFACGLLWSLAALTRPIAIWLWLPAIAVILFSTQSVRRRSPDRAAPSTAGLPNNHPTSSSISFLALITVFLLAFAPLLFLWSNRNHRLTGHYFVSTISTFNLLMYRTAGTAAEQQGTTQEAIEQQWLAKYGDIQFVESPEKFDQSLQNYQQAIHEKLFSAPTLLMKQSIIGCGKLLLGPGMHALDNSRIETGTASKLLPPIYVLALLAVLILALVGTARLSSRSIQSLKSCHSERSEESGSQAENTLKISRSSIIPLILLLYFVALSSGPESNSRFRVPITPFLAVLAVVGVCGVEKKES